MEHTTEETHRTDREDTYDYKWIIGVVGSICAIGALYYAKKDDTRKDETKRRLETIKEEEHEEFNHVTIKRETPVKLDTLD